MRLYTPELIPVVSLELIEGIDSMVMDGKKGNSYFERVHDYIMRENPAVGDYLVQCRERNPRFMRGAGAGRSLLTYAMIRSMGDSLFHQGKQPQLPEGCYTQGGIPIVSSDRFIELEEWFNDTPEDRSELIGILKSEMQDENPLLAKEVLSFGPRTPIAIRNIANKNAAMLYLAMKRQSDLYLSGVEEFCDLD